tara:strand:+ start:662 stop:943 length:282 start_codon:yes stop_codon:yes gene_type:complete
MMKITKRQLRKIIRENIRETFQSHTDEPRVGDSIVNVNPNCEHYGSRGVVISINFLPEDAGKTVEYQCSNRGPTWERGDVLEKTLDQLAPGWE